MPNPAPFKVAAVQAAPVFMDLQGTVKKTIKLIEDAAKGGAKLVNFAETWIPGYPLWAWVGPVANSMMSVIPYNENSLEIDVNMIFMSVLALVSGTAARFILPKL